MSSMKRSRGSMIYGEEKMSMLIMERSRWQIVGITSSTVCSHAKAWAR